MAGDEGEGSMNFHDYEGGGIGEGDGTKDVSDKIESEDQVLELANYVLFFTKMIRLLENVRRRPEFLSANMYCPVCTRVCV